MVKLSDALRGAADRAPLDGVTVSADAAARRVSMHRGLRGAATGVVGATAIGVIALGVIGPNGLATANGSLEQGETAAAGAAPNDAAASDGLVGEDMLPGTDDSRLAWGYCGQEDLAQSMPGAEASIFLLSATAPGEAEPGSTLPVEAQATLQDATLDNPDFVPDRLLTTTPGAWVLWDNIVVGTLPAEPVIGFGPADEQLLNESANLTSIPVSTGEVQTFTLEVPLVNCWDGAPLPAGKYELLTQQDFTAQGAWLDEMPAPGEDPNGAQNMALYTFSAFAEPLGFVIAGDPVDDPFGQYLNVPQPPVEPPTELPPPAPLPDGSLTPDMARQLFQDGVTDSAWDMAAGSQRWLLTHDSNQYLSDELYDDNAWKDNYFGCAMDGQTDGRFPARSSTMNLLNITGEVPARISLSYGWIVDGNPQYSLTARNTSDFTLTDFSPTLNSQLLLVRDGVAVAEAWGVDPVQNRGEAIAFDEAAAHAQETAGARDMGTLDAQSIVLPGFRVHTLTPGASVSSRFLWRDVQGCWNGAQQSAVAPGVYTLVSSQDVPVSNSQGYDMAPSMGLGQDGGSDMAIAPAQSEWVDLQVWTSLGPVTVD